MSNQDQQYVPVDNSSTYNPYQPRFVSYFTLGFGALTILGFALIILDILIVDFLPVQSLADLMEPISENFNPILVVTILSLVLAIGSEVYSRIKTPPATWRVKNELVRSLGQYGLLDTNNTDSWKGMFAVAPIGKYDKNAKCFTLPFLLRHVNSTETFEKVGDSISGFARCYSAEIQSDNSKRMYNNKLILWYTDNPYGEVSIEDMFND